MDGSKETMIENDSWESFQDIQDIKSKLHEKLDTKSKLLVIHALDCGQSKSELAQQYSVPRGTINNIYKQKEYLLETYVIEHNLSVSEQQCNIDRAVLEWFLLETKQGNYINENVFQQKAFEIINKLSDNCIDINNRLKEFQKRHHITEFVADLSCNLETKQQWIEFSSNFESSDIYFVGIFALCHNLDIEHYLKELSSDDYVSIMFAVNVLGTDKQQLAVIGNDVNVINPDTVSLPVKYYPCHTYPPLFHYSIINNYLQNWDSVLNKVGKNILLIVNLPDHLLHRFKFENIKLLGTRNLDYVTHVLEKIIECFKFNYRRLQISNRIESENFCLTQASDCIQMIAMAWHSVSSRYIELLSSPQMHGILHFNENGENYGNHSLSDWFKMKNIPLHIDQSSAPLDRYISCDSKLKCVDWRMEVEVPSTGSNSINTPLEESCSSLEAYQAMRRLVSYLHGQNAGSVIQNAKYLENHIEYRTLTQMHIINKNK